VALRGFAHFRRTLDNELWRGAWFQERCVALLKFTRGDQEVFAVALLPRRFPERINDDEKIPESSFVVPAECLGEVAASVRASGPVLNLHLIPHGSFTVRPCSILFAEIPMTMHSRIRNLIAHKHHTVRLDVEHLEDRVVPGETLTALLPMGLLPLGDLLSPQATTRAAALNLAVTDNATPAIERSISLGDLDARLLDTTPSLLSARTDAPAPVSIQHAQDEPVAARDTVFAGDLPGVDVALFSSLAEAAPTHRLPDVDVSPAGIGSSAGAAAFSIPMPVSGSSGGVDIAAPGAAVSPGVSGVAVMATGDAGGAAPLLSVQPMGGGHGGHGGGGGSDWTPAGYSPAQMRHAYGFDQLANDGTGQTIAIVDAYDDPNITSDLNTFSSQFGLPITTSGTFTFTRAYAQGSQPTGSTSWGQEISLDVEWAHAIAPHANILLVEAASNSYANLMGAVDYAVNHGAHVVSMSWGSVEFSGESSYDSHFNVSGVTFLASSSDTGGRVIYPSASPYVVSVGGTHLPLDSSGNLTSAEAAWGSGGGGASLYEAEPGYQLGYGISLGGRGTPDVSYNADPYTGVAVYDSYGSYGWMVIGGTSAGAPQWAGLVALADQGRGTPLSSNNLTTSLEYQAATGSVYTSDYRDITIGSNGYSAGTGYDLATGVGSPLANNLVPYLASY
jgi:hypothetical protein